MSTIKQIKVGGTTYDIVATDSDKLGGQEASKYALVANLPTQYAPVDAEKNVQSNWNETNTSSDAYIKNKPTIPTKSSWNYDDAYVKYSASQSLTDTQKIQARTNIGAGTSSFSGNYDDLTNKPTIPTVNNGTLTIQVNGTSKGTFTANQSGNSTVDITAEALGLSKAMRFLGSTTTAIGDGFTTKPITIKVDGVDTSITPAAGNVVLYGGFEYVWTGSAWEQLGQEGSFSLRGHVHPVETSTGNAAPHTHTHSVTVSGTTGNNSANTSVAKGTVSSTGTGATVATGSSGTATVLTGVKVSSTATVVQDTSTYGVDATGTATVVTGVAANGTTTAVTGLPNFSGGSGTTKYLHHSHTAASLGEASTGTVGISGGSVSTSTDSFVKTASYNSTTKILTITTGNAVTSVTHTAATLTGTKTFVTGYPSFSGGSGSLTSNTTADGGIPYIATHTAASLGTLSTATVLTGVKASGTTTAITGTAGTSSSSKKTSVATAVGADGTATAVTGVSTSKLDLVNVAAHTHTHDFSATPTTGNNSGSAVKAITAVTVKASE